MEIFSCGSIKHLMAKNIEKIVNKYFRILLFSIYYYKEECYIL